MPCADLPNVPSHPFVTIITSHFQFFLNFKHFSLFHFKRIFVKYFYLIKWLSSLIENLLCHLQQIFFNLTPYVNLYHCLHKKFRIITCNGPEYWKITHLVINNRPKNQKISYLQNHTFTQECQIFIMHFNY